MSTHSTHYVVLGVVSKNKKEIQKFFNFCEKDSDFMDSYDDNPYKEAIVKTKSGIHIIADGMCSEYVVVGKILSKGLNGLEMTAVSFPGQQDLGKNYAVVKKLSSVLFEIDGLIGTKFGNLELKLISFTHWH